MFCWIRFGYLPTVFCLWSCLCSAYSSVYVISTALSLTPSIRLRVGLIVPSMWYKLVPCMFRLCSVYVLSMVLSKVLSLFQPSSVNVSSTVLSLFQPFSVYGSVYVSFTVPSTVFLFVPASFCLWFRLCSSLLLSPSVLNWQH